MIMTIQYNSRKIEFIANDIQMRAYNIQMSTMKN